ncbi:tannase-domain-containing protein [Hortaea werneckii]|nr:tannase-domain-containing protein [Hortaea werneckii]
MRFHSPFVSAAILGAAANAAAVQREQRDGVHSPAIYRGNHGEGTASSGFLPIAQPTAPTASGSVSVAPASSDSSPLGYSKALSYARTSPATQPSESISTSVVTSEQTTVVPYTTVVTVYPTATSAATLSAASYGPASDAEGSQEEGSQPGASTYTTTLQSTTVLTHYSTKTLNVEAASSPGSYQKATSAQESEDSLSGSLATAEQTTVQQTSTVSNFVTYTPEVDQPGSSGIAPAAYESDSASAVADSSDSASKAPVSYASSSAVPPVAPDSSSVVLSSKVTAEPTYSGSSSSAYAYTTSIPYVTTTCSYIQAPYDAGNATYPLNGTAASPVAYPTGSAASSKVCSTITLTSAVSVGPTNSVNFTVTPSSSSANVESTGTAPARISASPIVSSNSTSLSPTGTMAPAPAVSVNSNVAANSTCASLCSSLEFTGDYTITPILCEAYEAGTTVPAPSGQSEVNCDSNQGALDAGICRVTLSIQTAGNSEAYMEVWMPNDDTTSWNGRTMSTDNGGLSGCVAYDDMTYVTGLGFAAFGDNGGHNSSSFDGTAFYQSNQNVLDWAFRSRHASVVAGKDVVRQFYGQEQDYAYYIGCSTGGQQGMHSAQYFPDDFDGIIAGSAAADFNHLEDWGARFVQLTGTSSDDPRFLTEDQWIFVQSYIFAQCDEALDGVNDGILEDPTACKFDTSAIPVCNDTETDNCLTSTQIDTVNNVFSPLVDSEDKLLYPALLYGSQVDAFRLGTLDGSTQGIAHDWYAYGVYNNSDFNITGLNEEDWDYADSLDEFHGNVSSYSGDLSAFRSAGGKMIIYHGMADPMVSGNNAQRYYLKVQSEMGLSSYEDVDPFMRLFRISGMAHCGVGGIAGPGAWMFGQSATADAEGVAENIIDTLVDWVENDNGPETITGTKFYYDTADYGVEFERPHCRYPFRTTYSGSGDWTDPSTWTCELIEDYTNCYDTEPRLCNADGSF